MAFDSNNWSKRIKLTIDSSKVDENLTNFPILITLSSGTGITSYDTTDVFDELITVSGTKKIAITTTISGIETELYTEIERWDWENEQVWLWTKVPTIVSGTNTDLYLYYDSTHADNTSYIGDTGDVSAENVWDNTFVGVWHMAQDPNGNVADCILNSTSSANKDGTPFEMSSDNLVDGKIGKAINFIPNDRIRVDDNSDWVFTNFSIAFLARWDGAPGDTGICGQSEGGGANLKWGLYWNAIVANNLTFHFKNPAGSSYNVDWAWVPLANTWYHLVIVRNSNSWYLYVNKILTGGIQTEAAATPNVSSNLYFGQDGEGWKHFKGKLDEICISNTYRSNAWIKAAYYSNWNNLITFSYYGFVNFYFSDPIPIHLSTVYGTSHMLQLTTTISGRADSYIYDAKFYDASDDSQIGSTIFGVNSGSCVSTVMQTLSGIDYSWYLWATSSGEENTSSIYSFTNHFLCAGYTEVNGTLTSGIPVRLYRRSTGILIGSDISVGISGTFEIETIYNENYYVVAIHPTDSGTNALIYDWVSP